MKDQGFNIEIHVDWSTGFIFGGNQNNCVTWIRLVLKAFRELLVMTPQLRSPGF